MMMAGVTNFNTKNVTGAVPPNFRSGVIRHANHSPNNDKSPSVVSEELP